MRTLTFILISFFALQLSAQKAIISFTTDSDCSVDIFDTMDNCYNSKQTTKKLILRKGKTTPYLTKEIKNPSIINLNFSDIGKTDVIIFPKDSINIVLSQATGGKKELSFQGSNQEGQQYMHENFYGIPLMKYMTVINNVIRDYKERKKGIQSIIPEINEIVMKPLLTGVEATASTPEYMHAAKTDIQCFLLSYTCLTMGTLITRKYIDIARPDSSVIVSKIDSITHLIPLSPELCRLSNGDLYASTRAQYSKQNEDIPSFFGKYKKYLSTPEYMWLSMLSNACLTQFRFGINELDVKEVARFLEEKYPDSEYVRLIKQKIREKEQENLVSFRTKFISKSIDSLSQLKDVPELKGKTLFVDLWATWCAPCRQELTNQKNLRQILATFNNIETVYISIDNPGQEKIWKEMVNHYRLEGYHLRAGKKLSDNIEKSIYENANMEIPRYFLLSPEGKIINADLPRPSKSEALKQKLNSIFNRK